MNSTNIPSYVEEISSRIVILVLLTSTADFMVNSFKFCTQRLRMLSWTSCLLSRYWRQREMYWTAAGSDPTTPYSDLQIVM